MNTPLTCDSLRQWLSADLDGEATRRECEAAHRHLATCPACRQARAAAETLRHTLANATARRPGDEARDEQLLLSLRRAGLCRGTADVEAEVSEAPHLTGRSLPPLLSSLLPPPGSLRHCGSSMACTAAALRPALATMAVSFLITWGSLQWAESPRPIAPAAPRSAAVPRPAPDTEFLERWLAGPPTLAALSHVPRPAAPAPDHRAPTRRGAAVHERKRFG